MTSKELKDRLNMMVIGSILNIAEDPTIVHKAEQIQGLIFNAVTDDRYWNNTEDDEIVIY